MLKLLAGLLTFILSAQFTVPMHTTVASGADIAGWPMNEGSGTTLHDLVASNNATLTGGAVTWQSNSGFPGTTPLWSGSGKAAAGTHTATDFDSTTPFSIALWVRSSSNTAQTLVSTLNTSASFKGWEVQIAAATGLGYGGMYFYLINTYPTNAIQVETANVGGGSPITISDGNLHFYVATYDGTGSISGIATYIDGVLQANANAISSTTVTASTASGIPIQFGARNNSTQEFVGVMAFVEIWPFVLTSGQVSTYYAAGPQLN
jgi:hypothetical protein